MTRAQHTKFGECGADSMVVSSKPRNRAYLRTPLRQAAHDPFTSIYASPRELGLAASAQRRPRPDLDLSSHAVAAGRLQLPTPADLFCLWRRGDWPLRPVGGRMDDARAAVALPAVGHLRLRQRSL